MRISRLALGFVAVPITIVLGVVLAFLEAAILGVIHPIRIIALAAAGAVGMFSLADRLGVLREPEALRTLSLSDDDPAAKPPGKDARPVTPK